MLEQRREGGRRPLFFFSEDLHRNGGTPKGRTRTGSGEVAEGSRRLRCTYTGRNVRYEGKVVRRQVVCRRVVSGRVVCGQVVGGRVVREWTGRGFTSRESGRIVSEYTGREWTTRE